MRSSSSPFDRHNSVPMQWCAYTWIQPVWIPRIVKFWTFFNGTFFNFLALDFLLFVEAM